MRRLGANLKPITVRRQPADEGCAARKAQWRKSRFPLSCGASKRTPAPPVKEGRGLIMELEYLLETKRS